MADFSGNTWLLLALIASSCAVAVLYSLAHQVRVEVHVHDLKLNVSRLRADYAERLRQLEETQKGDVIILPSLATPTKPDPQPAPEAEKPALKQAA